MKRLIREPRTVGTLTFHWAVNFGAVVQAYALQKALLRLGHDGAVLNYVPARVVAGEVLQRLKDRDWRYFVRCLSLRWFVVRNIHLAPRLPIQSRPGLRSFCDARFRAVVVGSDQVWNEWFVMQSSASANLTYFLEFLSGRVRRIAYAVSFGSPSLGDAARTEVLLEVRRFHRLAVREHTGSDILRGMGVESELVLDPSLLLQAEDYLELCRQVPADRSYVLVYLLHSGQSVWAKFAKERIARRFGGRARIVRESEIFSMSGWLNAIRGADFVFTNSFHVVAFCLLFHTPFVALPVSGGLAGMNDRLATLLGLCGLGDRLIFDSEADARIMDQNIVWSEVDSALDSSRLRSIRFLVEALE